MSEKNILIIGHSGFIGQSLYEKFKNKKKNIFLISRKKIFNQKNEVACDVFNDYSWFKLLKNNSKVFFLAFNNNLYELEKNQLYLKKIKKFSINFNEYILKKKLKIDFIFTSTVTIYGKTDANILVNEKLNDNPISNYDRAKKILEDTFFKYEKEQKINFVSLRLSNIYGLSHLNTQINRGFLNKLILNIYKEKRIYIYGRGNKLRNYLHIDDLVDALILSSKKMKKISGKIFILCHNKSYSFNDIIRITSKVFKVNIKLTKINYPKNINSIEKRSFTGSNKLIKNYIGWKPKINIQSGIKKILTTINRYANNN
jgi:UDP-glucose 4-epimerase